jgi:prepilin-type N-terminal cleavage/methylation domain-containing protein
MATHTRGFTVIELLIVIVILASASVLFFIQKNNVELTGRDQDRKTAINAMYYSLEEVFYTTNKYYPETINKDTVPSVEPTLFTDPTGTVIGEARSDYRYEPVGCVENKCQGYTLRTTLENEDDFVKTNRTN